MTAGLRREAVAEDLEKTGEDLHLLREAIASKLFHRLLQLFPSSRRRWGPFTSLNHQHRNDFGLISFFSDLPRL